MGEYADYGGESIKIGTCEDMYYLRFDQRHQVAAQSGSVDPYGKERFELRFRFPWPEEDKIEPGGFENYCKSLAVPMGSDLPVPEFEHYSVQFKATAGYLISLPCPESLPDLEFHGVKIGRNGFRGKVLICQQKPLKTGGLALICECGGCGSKYRLEEWSDAEPIVVALRSYADRCGLPGREDASRAEYYHAIADRITAGYGVSS